MTRPTASNSEEKISAFSVGLVDGPEHIPCRSLEVAASQTNGKAIAASVDMC